MLPTGKRHLRHKQKGYHLSRQTEELALVGLMCYFLMPFTTDYVPKPLRQNSFHSYRLLRKEIDIPDQPLSLEWCCLHLYSHDNVNPNLLVAPKLYASHQ